MRSVVNVGVVGCRRAAVIRWSIPSLVVSPLSCTTPAEATTHMTLTQRRSYRGESGDSEPSQLSPKEQHLLTLALPRSDAIMERHVRFPKLEEIPKGSFGPSDTTVHENDDNNNNDDLELQVRKKRLVYRSKQRGWLEVDLLLGTWAHENVPHLSPDELDDFEAFVNMETIDIYNIVTLRTDIPDNLRTEHGTGVVERIQLWARGHPLGKADPQTYERIKKDHNLI